MHFAKDLLVKNIRNRLEIEPWGSAGSKNLVSSGKFFSIKTYSTCIPLSA